MTKNSLGKWLILPYALIVFLSLIPFEKALADNATVLPKGMWQVLNETVFFTPTNTLYDNDGKVVRFDAPFNIPLNALVGLPAPANLGRSVVTIDLNQIESQFTPVYGVTNRLSVGVIIRYLHQETDFNGRVDSSLANTGKNPLIASPANPLGIGFPCAALGCTSAGDIAAGTTPLNLADVQVLLASAGFKPLTSWSESGFGDTDVGARYQYYQSDRFRAAFTGGVRLPTGAKEDIDNLLDRGFSTGAYTLLFQVQQDLLFGGSAKDLAGRVGFPSPGAGFIGTDFRYELVLPDSRTFRVCPPTAPICSTKAGLDRDIGDSILAEVRATAGLIKGIILRGQYNFSHKMKDDYSGAPSGVRAEDLEINTIVTRHQVKLAVTFTTIPWVIEKKFPIPLAVSFTWRDRFAGKNVLNTQFFGWELTVYGR